LVAVERISRDWEGEPCIVAAPGPSLTPEVAQACRIARWFKQWRIMAVQDAYRRMPFADAMYGCDERWWKVHDGAREFKGERWTTHEDGEGSGNDKSGIAEYGLRYVRGKTAEGFSRDPSVIHYGHNSGFQAVNLAMLRGVSRIVLVGFDMRRGHFFGDHPAPLHNRDEFGLFVEAFRAAAPSSTVPIVNATPGSALDAFPMVTLEDALEDDRVLRDRPVDHGGAGAGCAREAVDALRLQRRV
jgi:hypothetical protein